MLCHLDPLEDPPMYMWFGWKQRWTAVFSLCIFSDRRILLSHLDGIPISAIYSYSYLMPKHAWRFYLFYIDIIYKAFYISVLFYSFLFFFYVCFILWDGAGLLLCLHIFIAFANLHISWSSCHVVGGGFAFVFHFGKLLGRMERGRGQLTDGTTY